MGVKAYGPINLLDSLFLLASKIKGISQAIIGMRKIWAKLDRQFQFSHGGTQITHQGGYPAHGKMRKRFLVVGRDRPPG